MAGMIGMLHGQPLEVIGAPRCLLAKNFLDGFNSLFVSPRAFHRSHHVLFGQEKQDGFLQSAIYAASTRDYPTVKD
jgi:hypothetical protein